MATELEKSVVHKRGACEHANLLPFGKNERIAVTRHRLRLFVEFTNVML
jgi:hypothetical protein